MSKNIPWSRGGGGPDARVGLSHPHRARRWTLRRLHEARMLKGCINARVDQGKEQSPKAVSPVTSVPRSTLESLGFTPMPICPHRSGVVM